MSPSTVTLPRDSNQALGIGQYAIDFLSGSYPPPDPGVLARTESFYLDSIACSVAALATGMNAPHLLRAEALRYRTSPRLGVTCLASNIAVAPEKAILANCAAARELDANGTNFGYNPATGYCRGEFGHNDFYPVVIAAAQLARWNGRQVLTGMLCLDEIRGRLAEVFGLKDHKIDHVLHGAIASAAVYGAILGATARQIESAIGLTVAHYVPFRAIRHGHQLSDSKGASAAISAEAAVVSMRRALDGFVGPADIFRNPQAVFCLFEPPPATNSSPFDLTLATTGPDFAVLGMHFKLGLYEHQSAGAIQGLLLLLERHPEILAEPQDLTRIRITIYEPAFSIIGDPHKRVPRTRQSADHSLVYIVSTLLRKAIESKSTSWEDLSLMPADYDESALFHPITRSFMAKIDFRHGGREYDDKYPDGIPTTVELSHRRLGDLSSGLVMYPEGHARNTSGRLPALLANKVERLFGLGVADPQTLRTRFSNIAEKSADDIHVLHDFTISGLADPLDTKSENLP